jgi:isopenicillin N synthase-like dioxygenase
LSLDQMANSILKLDAHKTPNFKGYTVCRKRKTDLGNRVSVFEAFDIGRESAPETSANDPMAGSNSWPSPDVSLGFREAIVEY